MISVNAMRETTEQARTAYESAANQYALQLSRLAALLVHAQKPTATLLVFDKDEETVSADTTIEIVSIQDADGADLGALDSSTDHEVCVLIRTAYDGATGFYPAASQDTYDTESSEAQWRDRNLLELHIDILLSDRTDAGALTRDAGTDPADPGQPCPVNAFRRKSRLDATVEVRANDPRSAAQQCYAITQALTQSGFTVNDLVLYSRDALEPTQPRPQRAAARR